MLEYVHICARPLELARRGQFRTCPNPMVGAVLLRDDKKSWLRAGIKGLWPAPWKWTACGTRPEKAWTLGASRHHGRNPGAPAGTAGRRRRHASKPSCWTPESGALFTVCQTQIPRLPAARPGSWRSMAWKLGGLLTKRHAGTWLPILLSGKPRTAPTFCSSWPPPSMAALPRAMAKSRWISK